MVENNIYLFNPNEHNNIRSINKWLANDLRITLKVIIYGGRNVSIPGRAEMILNISALSIVDLYLLEHI